MKKEQKYIKEHSKKPYFDPKTNMWVVTYKYRTNTDWCFNYANNKQHAIDFYNSVCKNLKEESHENPITNGYIMLAFKRYLSLVDQANQARKVKNKKRNDLAGLAYDDQKHCIKLVQVQSLGMPTEGHSQIEIVPQNCNDFTDGKVCTKTNCPMLEKNKEYADALYLYQMLKKQRKQAWKDIFTRKR